MRLARPRRWRHWTLRSRLTLTAATLTALALLVANGAGLVLLRSYLVDRVDSQLSTMSKAQIFSKTTLLKLRQGPLADPGSAESVLSKSYARSTRIYTIDGTKGPTAFFAGNPAGPGPHLPSSAELAGHTDSGPYTVPGEHGGSSWRIAVRSVPSADGELVITAASLEAAEATYNRMLLIDAAVMAGMLALLGAASALLIRLGLRPLTRMQATATAIAAGHFGQRVADADPHTEPGRLGQAMNAMLTRIESEFSARTASEQRLRRFLADASHELRTPLTSIRGFAELCRRGGDQPDALRRIEAEAARMGVLVEDLLLLARLDEQRALQQVPVDLLELCADVLSDLHARSPARDVRLTALDEAAPGGSGARLEPVVVTGDPLRLRQVLGNVIANADRHTPRYAQITVRLGTVRAGTDGLVAAAAGDGPRSGTPTAVVEVADTGPGVPDHHAPYVFERLYRADAARSGGGSGLGLSIAAALVAAHRGRIELAATAPGTGAVFRVVLPLG